eukprot:247254-Rhodomonas_salina.1
MARHGVARGSRLANGHEGSIYDTGMAGEAGSERQVGSRVERVREASTYDTGMAGEGSTLHSMWVAVGLQGGGSCG